MTQGYLGEIRMFAGDFAPQDWALCDGSLLPISANPWLFQLLGTTYGGDGHSNFALPDLRGRVPIGQGQSTGLSERLLGQAMGVEQVALVADEVAAHGHALAAGGKSAVKAPGNDYPGQLDTGTLYYKTPTPAPSPAPAHGVMAAAALSPSSGNGALHNNIMPSTVLSYIICTHGVMPKERADDPYMGEIKAFSSEMLGQLPPEDWHVCDGALLTIKDRQALYSLLGTQYGGDGITTFALPDLRGRAMMGQDTPHHVCGNQLGVEAAALSVEQMPAHTHSLNGNSGIGTASTAVGNLPAGAASTKLYAIAQYGTNTMADNTVASTGGALHHNMQPSLVINYCIATTGMLPPKD